VVLFSQILGAIEPLDQRVKINRGSGINNLGQVVGYSETASGNYQALIYTRISHNNRKKREQNMP